MKALIGVAREGERRQAGFLDRDAELLVEFAYQGFLGPLAGLDLAARKLPQPRQLLAFRALRQKNAIVRVDQGDGDDEGEFERRHLELRHRPPVPERLSPSNLPAEIARSRVAM